MFFNLFVNLEAFGYELLQGCGLRKIMRISKFLNHKYPGCPALKLV